MNKFISLPKLTRFYSNLTGKILNTTEEISANTNEDMVAGALALKSVNNSLVSDIYVGDDGKLHKVKGGADTVLPFSGGEYYLLHGAVVNSAYKGGTYTIPENVYPSRVFVGSTNQASMKDTSITKEQYDASSTLKKITLTAYGNQTAYLYKDTNTSLKIEATNMGVMVVLGSAR